MYALSSAYSPLTYNRPLNININIGNYGPSAPSGGGWHGPSFHNQGFDQMFSPFGGPGMASPLNFLMSMMQSLLQMMTGGQMPSFGNGMPPFGAEHSHYPQPDNFWSTDNGQGYQNHFYGGSDSHISGGRYSNNHQYSSGGHGLQTNNSGFGSRNFQTHNYGTSQQRITTGSNSYNVQNGGWHAQQTLHSGHNSYNQQSAAGGNSSQASITGHNSVTHQSTTFGGPGSVQASKSGHGSSTFQVGASEQIARSGSNSTTTQVGGDLQIASSGSNSVVAQGSQVGNNATQIATVGPNSAVVQSGGQNQVANLNGSGSNVAQEGSGGTHSVVNVNGNSNATTLTYDSNGTSGNTWEANYGDGADNRVLKLNGDGYYTRRNMGGGNDRVTVDLKDPRNHGGIELNGEAGNDTFVFKQMPQDPNAPVIVNGGVGNNTLQVPSGPFTLVGPDGQVLHEECGGGPRFTVSGINQVVTAGEDGQMRTVYTAPQR